MQSAFRVLKFVELERRFVVVAFLRPARLFKRRASVCIRVNTIGAGRAGTRARERESAPKRERERERTARERAARERETRERGARERERGVFRVIVR